MYPVLLNKNLVANINITFNYALLSYTIIVSNLISYHFISIQHS
jgi:hypothetical protein